MAGCRTCHTKTVRGLQDLSAKSLKYPEKRLCDLLAEFCVLQLRPEDADHVDMMPKQICNICVRRLHSACEFLLQAKSRQRELMDHFKLAERVSDECLQELLFDVSNGLQLEQAPVEPNPHSDTYEGNDKEKTVDILTSDPLNVRIVKQEKDVNSDQARNILPENLEVVHTTIDTSFSPSEEGAIDELKDESDLTDLWDSNSNDFDSDYKLTSSRTRNTVKRTKRANLKHGKKYEFISCLQCKKTFTTCARFHRHLQTHGLKEEKRGAHLSMQKRAKDVDLNLCKPNGYKLILCMICNGRYSKIPDLRTHLSEHPEFSFTEREETLTDLAELFNVNIENINEKNLIETIRNDLAGQKYDAYYSITNQSGYEMSLNSSETEMESEDEAEGNVAVKRDSVYRAHKYICEICKNSNFKRKYQLYEHQRAFHNWLECTKYVCTRCDARFISSQQLTSHYRAQCKNPTKRFNCRKCPLRFRWRQNLLEHYKEHRIKCEPFSCPQCHRVFDKKKSLTVHLRLFHADETSLIPCKWCNRKFYRRDYLIKHLRRHGLRECDLPRAEVLKSAMCGANGRKQIECKLCNIKFSQTAELRAHFQRESQATSSNHQHNSSPLNYYILNQSGFELSLSDSDTNDDDSDTINLTIKHPNAGRYICELCQVQCKRKYELMEHQWAMHRFANLPQACEHCIFKCVSKTILNYHIRTQCQNTDKKHVCEKCGYKFMWTTSLDQHMQTFHLKDRDSNMAELGQTTASLTSAAQSLHCPHCDKVYVQRMRLNNHIRDVHTKSTVKKKKAENRFLCSFCGLEAQSAAALQIHIRRHTGEKPFKCDLCDMAFAHHYDMVGHRRKHTGEKPYHCTICSKDFSKSDKLKRHMLIHSGVKPHKCNLCDKSYRQAKDLALHKQKHTGETDCVCTVCGDKFLQSSALEKHRIMKRHYDEAK